MFSVYWVAAIVGVASPLAGQLPPPPLFNENVVVTATLEKEERRNLPAAISVIDGDEIRARQAADVYELLRTVPGLSVSRSGSPGKQVSVFSRGTESDQTLVLWNGLRLNDPYFGGFDWAFLPTDGIERIEVVRGPSSALHGSDAMGGVVQILSGRGAGGSARIEVGEDSYGRAGMSWGGDFGRARIDVAGHLRQGDGAAENDFYDGSDAMTRVEWALGDNASMGLLARTTSSEIGIPVAFGAETPKRRQETDALQVEIPFEVRLGRWRVEASIAEAKADLLFVDPDALFSRNDTDTGRLQARSVATYRADNDLWVAIGGTWSEEEVTNSSNFGPNLDAETRQSYAVFGEVHKAWGRLRLDAGARSEHDELYGGEVSPNIGLVLELPANVEVFTRYGEGFRAPSLGELFFPFYGNPELLPEQSASWEVGLRQQGEHWWTSVAGFSTDLDNLIETDPLTFTAVNVGRARIEGAEIEIGYRRGTVDVRANATWLDTEDRSSGEELLRRPARSVNALLSWRPEPFVVTLTTRWVGERDDLDPLTFSRTRNDAYWVADIGATWQASHSLAPFARVQNVSDENYQEVLGFPAPGRTLIAGIEVAIP